MGSFFHRYHLSALRKDTLLFLAGFWILGLVSGAWSASADYSAVNRAVFGICRVIPSFCGMFACAVFFLVLSYLAARISGVLLCPVAFFKGFCFGFAAECIALTFGDAGWLFQFFLLFSSGSITLVLWMWWLHLLKRSQSISFLNFVFLLSLAFLISSFDYSVVSPFFVNCLSF